MPDNLFSTDIALFAVWDPVQLAFINSDQAYFDNFSTEEEMVKLINNRSCVVWSTKSDGYFPITVRLDGKLNENEKNQVKVQSNALSLQVSGNKIYFGSPEWVGFREQEAINKKLVASLSVEPGLYTVNVYGLLREEGSKKYLDYLVNLAKASPDQPSVSLTSVPVVAYSEPETIDLQKIPQIKNPSVLLSYLKTLTVEQIPSDWENVVLKASFTNSPPAVIIGEFYLPGDPVPKTFATGELYAAIFKRIKEIYKVTESWNSAELDIKKDGPLNLEVGP